LVGDEDRHRPADPAEQPALTERSDQETSGNVPPAEPLDAADGSEAGAGQGQNDWMRELDAEGAPAGHR